jgi:hypothetical protein
MGQFEEAIARAYNNTVDGVSHVPAQESLSISGYAYASRKVIPVPVSGAEIIIDTSSYTPGRGVVFLPPLFTAVNAGPLIVTAYIGATYTGGTEQIANNRNVLMSAPETKVILNPASIDTPGVEGPDFLVPSLSSTGAIPGSSSTATIGLPIAGLNGAVSVIRLKIVNNDTVEALMEYNFSWFEL